MCWTLTALRSLNTVCSLYQVLPPREREGNEIDYLKRVFVFGGTLNQETVLQKYDAEWAKYIDLDKDSTPLNKDKLKDVLLRSRVETASTSGTSDTLLFKVS